MTMKIIIDAKNAILGRLCSFAAKQALLGKEVAIVNCEEAVITGNRADILQHYLEKRRRGGTSLKGPHFPKSPERIMKRTIRGMLQYKKGRSLDAFKRIKCYDKMPAEFEKEKKIKAGKEKTTKTITLLEVSKLIS